MFDCRAAGDYNVDNNFYNAIEGMARMSFSWHHYHQMIYLTADLLTAAGVVKHAFSTRHGQRKGKVTTNFDLGLKNADPVSASEMRQQFLAAVGIDLVNLVAGQQSHGTRVQVVTTAPRGAYSWENGFPATDALITAQPNIALSVYTADCVPLLFLDPVRKCIGAAHAGWRGSIEGIAVATLAALRKNFGSRPEHILVAIGPAIGPCCYEVDQRVLLPLSEHIPFWRELIYPSRPGHYRLDLWTLNQRLLTSAGVKRPYRYSQAVHFPQKPGFFPTVPNIVEPEV